MPNIFAPTQARVCRRVRRKTQRRTTKRSIQPIWGIFFSDKRQETTRLNRIQISVIWLIVSAFTLVMSGLISCSVMNMSVTSPFHTSFIAAAFSLLHPGGWLCLGGLFAALGTRRFEWLGLSLLGSILIGITVPILEGIGAAAF